MRAQQLDQPAPIGERPLHVIERAETAPPPGELRLDVAACGVCRTDLQLIEGDLAARHLPIVPGHQIVGRVAAVGAGVEEWSIGDRVGVAWLGGACGACDFCRRGHENLCPDAEFTGWDRDGGYANTATARADFVFALPGGFDDTDAAPLLCGGVIGYRSLKVSGIAPGGHLGLYGFGASALLTIQVATHWGCEVFVATRSADERRRATALGASWVGDYADPPPVPLDAAITFAPVGSVVVAALRAIRPGGTVAINAIHLDRMPEFNYDLLWRERGLRSVANFTRADATEFIELAATIPIRTEYEVHALGEANDVLGRLAAGAVGGAAVLVPDS
ncbi:MAG: zinc-dependent alcohol dehydrogenase family protein [Ilumatobacteraceae bacterium]|nr:zinc-dependent alcohol dehydrogenase family protein [Ilumatobacteraceae bacterium]